MPRCRAEQWLYSTDFGLYCEPGDFYIDPHHPIDRAIITHGHSDHARSGHARVLATPETAGIMRVRYGDECAGRFEEAAYGETTNIGGVSVSFAPAGHILGSAQIVLEWQGTRVVAAGDYKRAPDPTCAPFEVVPCDVFITEATFGLPLFRHEQVEHELERLFQSMEQQPERAHLLGVYGLGKCQRMLAVIRAGGYDRPIFLHGALVALTEFYQNLGQDFGDVRPAMEASREDLTGALVFCPPSALSDRWSRRFGDSVTCFASGWMRVRGRARQRGVELPLIVSDHADWPELLATIEETGAEDIWVTHGREDALVHQLTAMGRRAKALSLVGFEDEAE